MKRIRIFSLVVICLFVLVLINVLTPSTIESANLTATKDTLSSSRLSFMGRVDSAGTSVGSSVVLIDTVASDPSNSVSTANLAAGDTIHIGESNYTVDTILDGDQFTITTTLAAGDADDGDLIYVIQRPIHTITFTTASAVPNGFFQVLLPAATNDIPAGGSGAGNEGVPDSDGFDFGGGSVTITGTDATDYDFISEVSAATVSGAAGCTAPANYHCFEFHYGGDGAASTAITLAIGSGANTPIAPGPKSGHTEATADEYRPIIKNFASGANPNTDIALDQTTVSIGIIESVRVTATVDPSITFTIAGVASGATNCGAGASTDIDTTTGTNAPLAVPFGSLTLNTFADAQHLLTVSTNASGGYAVTAAEDDQLSIGGAGVITIPDTDCDNEDCTITSGTEWNTGTDNGFGYSLQNSGAASISFEWDDTALSFKAKPFAVLGTDTPETLFSSTTVANAEAAYVCYRISVGATQQAGDYENLVTYTATATF